MTKFDIIHLLMSNQKQAKFIFLRKAELKEYANKVMATSTNKTFTVPYNANVFLKIIFC